MRRGVLFAACRQDVKGLRIAYSPTLGYARPDAEVLRIVGAAAKQFETLGCTVDLIERVFERDPVDIWSAEFYAGAGTRLRPFLETKRELIDPAVADILDQALRQELRNYYDKVFERYALRDKLRPLFERYDILLSPVLPVTSLDVGKNVPDHLGDRNLVSWVYYTYPFNLTGQPAATTRRSAPGSPLTACRSACRSSAARSAKWTWCGPRQPTSAASRQDIMCGLSSRPDPLCGPCLCTMRGTGHFHFFAISGAGPVVSATGPWEQSGLIAIYDSAHFGMNFHPCGVE